jgi:imidazolonepropionase-like amidohydrolase
MAENCTVFKGGTLIDGNGGDPVADSVVVVDGDRISAAGVVPEGAVPDGAEIVDISGKTVMPGLIDAHIHLTGLLTPDLAAAIAQEPHVRTARSVYDAWRIIDSGFTTIREIGGMYGIFIKRAVEEGSIVGPRIVASGLAVSQTAGHGDIHFVPPEWAKRFLLGRVADGVAEVRKAAREQLREGADFLKIMTTGGVMSEKDRPTQCQYSMEEIRAFVEEAKNADVKTASHAQGTQGIKNAVIGGIDSIEHGFFMDDECIELMVKNGTHLVPTFVIVDLIVTMGRDLGIIESSVRKAETAQQAHLESFRRVYEAGILCGLGSDFIGAPMYGKSAMELDLYVNKAGRTPMEAIVCATKNNAIVLGLEDEIGILEAGKRADLIVVDGDPRADIKVLQDITKITHVYKDGKPVPRMPAGL